MNWYDPIPTWLLMSFAYIGLWTTVMGLAWVSLRAWGITTAFCTKVRANLRAAR